MNSSTEEGYNSTASGYITIDGATPTGNSGSYINSMKFTKDGMYPKNSTGNNNIHYCDGLWYKNSQVNIALVGGACNNGTLNGALCYNIATPASSSGWNINTSVSCKPVVNKL